METKQVLVIRKDLKMRKGKIASQAAHASMEVFFDRIGTIVKKPEGTSVMNIGDLHESEIDWIKGTFTKITVSVNSEEELIAIHEKAKEAGIPTSLITDIGKTEFNGVPTKTAVAVGPFLSEEIDKITSNLPLL